MNGSYELEQREDLRQPEEAIALGGNRFQSRIVNTGQYQFMMTGRLG